MAYLQITLQVDPVNRVAAAGVYEKYKQSFLASELFTRDVVGGLSPLLKAAPEVRVYDAV
ncbi:hypothetical protein AB0I00_14110 [Streptomyces sp. NPDC050803]|uniref:hypothetical protein n=1 Tax=unclassified Streptomyces TaxID=2593676 RepID=UPI0034140091